MSQSLVSTRDEPREKSAGDCGIFPASIAFCRQKTACWEIPKPLHRLKGGRMARRAIKIDLRLSESEAEALNRDVKKAGVSREAYLRSLIRKMPLKEKPPMDLVEVLKNLNQINHNMNQIAVKANAKGFVDASSYWDNVRWLQETVSKLMEVIYS